MLVNRLHGWTLTLSTSSTKLDGFHATVELVLPINESRPDIDVAKSYRGRAPGTGGYTDALAATGLSGAPVVRFDHHSNQTGQEPSVVNPKIGFHVFCHGRVLSPRSLPLGRRFSFENPPTAIAEPIGCDLFNGNTYDRFEPAVVNVSANRKHPLVLVPSLLVNHICHFIRYKLIVEVGTIIWLMT